MTRRAKTSYDAVDLEILQALRSYPPPTMREIASKIKMSHISVYNRFRWLKANGFIGIAPSVEKQSTPRGTILTPKGFDLLESEKKKNVTF